MIERFRSAFSPSGKLVHLNNAGFAPTSQPARDALISWANRFHDEGVHCTDAYYEAVDRAREDLASLLGAQSNEVVYFQNTAGAISQVAFGMKLGPGNEIVTWDQEYGSLINPWKVAAERTGATLKIVPSGVDLETPWERLLENVTQRTKVIAFSWVQFQTGAITDFEQITRVAREQGIWTVMDGIQGLGVRPFHFGSSGLDAVCGGSHKWMTSPIGVGFLALRQDRLNELQPVQVGIRTFEIPGGSQHFEPGSKQVLDIVALGASCRWICDTGIGLIAAEAERLARKLVDGLRGLDIPVNSPHGSQWKGAIVNFGSGNLDTMKKKLVAAGISYAERGPGLRLSPHGFNTDADIDRALNALGRSC